MMLLSFVLCAPSSAQRVIRVGADVGADGFATPQAAIDSIPDNNKDTIVIELAPGTYKQHLTIPKGKDFITIRGTDATTTILTDDKNVNSTHPDGKKFSSREFASTHIQGNDFHAENVTFENTAGNNGQALAIFMAGDRNTFRNCRFLGWQDTLRTNNGRSYFEDCYIEGHVDFIYGSGAAWFENCAIHCLADGYITAASTDEKEAFGYVFNRCKITADAKMKRTYLGRPWRPFASVVFMNCELPAVIDPAGWNNWGKVENEKTARYAEYANTGAGTDISKRASWAKQLSDDEAKMITVDSVLSGKDGWRAKSQISREDKK